MDPHSQIETEREKKEEREREGEMKKYIKIQS
jgi:hypothetical protein